MMTPIEILEKDMKAIQEQNRTLETEIYDRQQMLLLNKQHLKDCEKAIEQLKLCGFN